MLDGELYVLPMERGSSTVFDVRRWRSHEVVSSHATLEEAQRLCDLANHELYEKAGPHQRKIAETTNKLIELFHGRN